MNTNSRPVFLNLMQFRFPLPAIMSVGHRASGILMVLLIPLLVYLLDLSTSGPDGFARAAAILDHGFVKLLMILVLWALIHHLLAGIRFLLIDFEIGVEREEARKSATVVMVAAPVIALIIGVLL